MGTNCSTDSGKVDLADLKEENQVQSQDDESINERKEIYKIISESSPMWMQDAETFKEKQAAELKLAEEAQKAKAEQDNATPGAGVWADGESGEKVEELAKKTSLKEEDAPKKTIEDPTKKKKSQEAAKKRKDESTKKKKEDEEAQKKETARQKSIEEEQAQTGPNKIDEIKARETAWRKKSTKDRDDLGTKIRKAAKEGNTAGVQALIAQGVSPNAEDGDGWTPLIKAADASQVEMCKLLLESGANPNLAIKLGEWGQTALHFSCRHGCRDIAELLAPVTNRNMKNYLHKTAAEVAKAEGHKDLAKWLKSLDK